MTDTTTETSSEPSPCTICPDHTNAEVQVWLYFALKHIDPILYNDEAWRLAERFQGDGRAALHRTRREWASLYPSFGEDVFELLRFPQERQIVWYVRLLFGQYIGSRADCEGRQKEFLPYPVTKTTSEQLTLLFEGMWLPRGKGKVKSE